MKVADRGGAASLVFEDVFEPLSVAEGSSGASQSLLDDAGVAEDPAIDRVVGASWWLGFLRHRLSIAALSAEMLSGLRRFEAQGRGALHLESVFYHYAFFAALTTR